jgi:glutathione S-transferase
MVAIDVSPEYGWVILGAVIGNEIISIYLGGQVMGARRKFDVQYPNAYATPNYHKNADEFNRYQRGHQNFLEYAHGYRMMTLIGGLEYPLACAIGSLFWSVGCVLYLKGYADSTLDVKTARYKRGAGIKWIGWFTSFYCTCAFGYSLFNV